MTNKFQFLADLVDICARQGVQQVIISPGSRSAPLTAAFAAHPTLTCRVVMDERAAGFIALGLAQQTGQPTALICTSGTAALNYAPAVAEAFYQRVPLLLFTADRPPEWIDQQDGQTIHQHHLYGSHSRGFFELPVDRSHPDAHWHAHRLISEAIIRARRPIPGPVQINVPLREPLYASDDPINPSPAKLITVPATESLPTVAAWDDLLAEWQQLPRKLIIVGQNPPDSALITTLQHLQTADPSLVSIADVTANLHTGGTSLLHSDIIFSSQSPVTRTALIPDLVISLGGPVISKSLKQFLRQNHPTQHWHLDPGGEVTDTFQSLTRLLPISPSQFFTHLAYQTEKTPIPTVNYRDRWNRLETAARQLVADFFAATPFGEFAAVYQVLNALPAGSHLQLGNSMPVRYAGYISLGGDQIAPGITVNANRGTSGIDGTLSTAVGAAMATPQITTLITGDLAFFYDRNALWHNHIPPNLRVVLLNNHGGGIFKVIEGPNRLPPGIQETYFVTPHTLTARNTAADHNLAYFYVRTADDLIANLPGFFAANRAAILEVETDSTANTEIFKTFKAHMTALNPF